MPKRQREESGAYDRRTFIKYLKERCERLSRGAQLDLQREQLAAVECGLTLPAEGEQDLAEKLVSDLAKARMQMKGQPGRLFSKVMIEDSVKDSMFSKDMQIATFMNHLATAATDLTDPQRAEAARFYEARIRHSVKSLDEYTERARRELDRLPDTESARVRWSSTRALVLKYRDEQRKKFNALLAKVAPDLLEEKRLNFVRKTEVSLLQKSASAATYIATLQAKISSMTNAFEAKKAALAAEAIKKAKQQADKAAAAARANNAVAAAKFDIYKESWLAKLRAAHAAFANAAKLTRAAVESAFASERDKHQLSLDFLLKFVRRCAGRIAFLETPPAQALGGLTDDEKRTKIAAEQRKAERIYDQFRKIMPSAAHDDACMAALQRCHDAPPAIRARVASVLREVAVRNSLAVAVW